MKLSVIMACYNGAATISAQLEALSQQSLSEPWELIVSDNGSNDASRQIVEGYADRIPYLRVVDSSDRRGAAHARNVALKVADSDRFVFCDTDDVVGPGWLAHLDRSLDRNDFVVSGIEYRTLNKAWQCDLYTTPYDGPQPEMGFLPAAASYGFGFTRSLFVKVGEFDESLPRMSDFDYSWRVQLAGYRLHFVREAVVHYRLRSTLSGLLRQYYVNGQAEVLLYKKYAAYGMPWRKFREAVRGWIDMGFRLLSFRTRRERMFWLIDAAVFLGRIRGSIRYGVLAL